MSTACAEVRYTHKNYELSEVALISYLRKGKTHIIEVNGKNKVIKRGKPFAVLVADKIIREDGSATVQVGWSHRVGSDPVKFSKAKAREIAMDRMLKNKSMKLHPALVGKMKEFKARCERYYKMPVTPSTDEQKEIQRKKDEPPF